MAFDSSKLSPAVAPLRSALIDHPFVCGCVQGLSPEVDMAFSGKRINKPPVTRDGQKLFQAAVELLEKCLHKKNIAAAKKTNR